LGSLEEKQLKTTRKKKMKYDLAVMGLGYIGLPMAALSAKNGMNVLGVDIRADIVETVNAGKIHIEEPGLIEVVSPAVASGKLKAATNPAPSDIFMIAVPTPVDHHTHRPGHDDGGICGKSHRRRNRSRRSRHFAIDIPRRRNRA
jgi:UDP-N-acetyl-D-mannosaminuronate dehydrogenase